MGKKISCSEKDRHLGESHLQLARVRWCQYCLITVRASVFYIFNTCKMNNWCAKCDGALDGDKIQVVDGEMRDWRQDNYGEDGVRFS